MSDREQMRDDDGLRREGDRLVTEAAEAFEETTFVWTSQPHAREALRLCSDGTIKIGPGLTPDDAARTFVEALRPQFAKMLREDARSVYERIFVEQEGHPRHPLLTPVHGGHVWAGTWEGLSRFDTAVCAACRSFIKRDGALLTPPDGVADDSPSMCAGWPEGDYRGQLARVVRAIVREAPDDKPNGPVEEALQAMYDAHVDAIGEHGGGQMLVEVAAMKRQGDAMHTMGERLADQDRALRLALEHDERAASRPVPLPA